MTGAPSASHYDEDTRHAIRNVLEEKAPDLSEWVRRAERGESIWDLVNPPELLPHSIAALAEHIAAVLAHPKTPEGLYNAIVEEISNWSSDYLRAAEKTAPFIESCLLYQWRERREQPEGGSEDDHQR